MQVRFLVILAEGAGNGDITCVQTWLKRAGCESTYTTHGHQVHVETEWRDATNADNALGAQLMDIVGVVHVVRTDLRRKYI